MKRFQWTCCVLTLLCAAACTRKDEPGTGTGGTDQSSGGSVLTGGVISTGGDITTGGSAATGGDISTGGVASTGGDITAGGSASTGGTASTGGSASTGGVAATGGSASTGGDITTGGSVSTGGAAPTGGSVSTGGAASTGGSASTGGDITTGGSVGTGGAASTGGNASTGGVVATGGSVTTGGTASAGGHASTGGVVATGGDTTPDPLCEGGGPIITVPDDNAGETCVPALSRRLFSRAICTCEDTWFAGYLKTRSFDSNADYPWLAQSGAPVGINGRMNSGSYVDVGGSLRIMGATQFAGFLEVGGDLELAQDLTLPGYLRVHNDAWLAGNSAVTAATIVGDLMTHAGKITPPAWSSVGGEWSTGEFAFDEPCACDEDELLNIDAIIADGKANNDNTAIGLSEDAFADHIGYERWTLPCGRYYVDEITGIGDIELRIEGRVALFVGDDVGITGRFDIELAPGAELDLFIGDDLVQIGYGTFGDVNRPSDLRVFVSGDEDIVYLGYQPFAGNLYAPRAKLSSAGYIDVEGSLFVRDLWSAGYIDVTYDRAIVEPTECPEEPEPECTSTCSEACGGGACIDGECGSCRSNADCCAPLVCVELGYCMPLLLRESDDESEPLL